MGLFTQPTAAQLAVAKMDANLTALLEQMIATFYDCHRIVWQNQERATAEEIFAELGERGADYIVASEATIGYINSLAPPEKAVVSLKPEGVVLTPNPDGSITVTMPEG